MHCKLLILSVACIAFFIQPAHSGNIGDAATGFVQDMVSTSSKVLKAKSAAIVKAVSDIVSTTITGTGLTVQALGTAASSIKSAMADGFIATGANIANAGNTFVYGGSGSTANTDNNSVNGGSASSANTVNNFVSGGSASNGNPGNNFVNGGSRSNANQGNNIVNGGSASNANPGNNFDNGGSGSNANPENNFDNGGSGSNANQGNNFVNGGSASNANSGNNFNNGGSTSNTNQGNNFDKEGSASNENSDEKIFSGRLASNVNRGNNFDNGGLMAKVEVITPAVKDKDIVVPCEEENVKVPVDIVEVHQPSPTFYFVPNESGVWNLLRKAAESKGNGVIPHNFRNDVVFEIIDTPRVFRAGPLVETFRIQK